MKIIIKLATLILGFALITILSQRAEAAVSINISGNPDTITIVAPVNAGDLPADQENSSTTTSWSSDEVATAKITGQLASLFSGIDLYVTVAAPGGADGTSTGEQKILAAGAVDYVTGIGSSNVSNQAITYRANVTEMVAPYTNTQIVVTWTIQTI